MKNINSTPTGKEIFVWNIVGSMASSLLSVVTLMLVTRMLSGEKADIFSIAWSISQLMATIGTFQIRTYQATDVTEVFKFGQYLWFRMISNVVMMLCSAGYVIVKHYSVYKASIVLIICLFRAVDGFADIYEGYFQQKERLDLVGKACTYRIVIGVSGFALSLFLWHDLMISCIVLLLAYVVSFVIFNIRYSVTVKCFNVKEAWNKNIIWIWNLIKEGAPIFINAFLMMAITNAPKMKIDSAIAAGQLGNGIQTIFSVLFMPASVLTLAYIVFRPLLTKMAIEWACGRKQGFLKIVKIIFLCLIVMAVLLMLGSFLLGIPVLSILYALDLERYRNELLIMVAGGCFCTFSYVLDNALVVIRRQYLLVCSYVISWVYVKLVVAEMVNRWELMGAAMAYATSMIVFFAVTLVIFMICLKKEKNNE